MCGRRSIMLCEGRSDEDFVEALKKFRGQLDHVEISRAKKDDPKGWGGFAARLEALRGKANIEKYKAIVILCDSDDDPAIRVKDLRNQFLQSAIFNVPAAAWMAAQAGSLPPLHIVNLPRKAEPGTLETLLIRAIEAKYNGIAAVADAYFAAVDTYRQERFQWSISKHAKLRLRLELAAAYPQDPLRPFGKLWVDENGQPRDPIGIEDGTFNELTSYLMSLAD